MPAIRAHIHKSKLPAGAWSVSPTNGSTELCVHHNGARAAPGAAVAELVPITVISGERRSSWLGLRAVDLPGCSTHTLKSASLIAAIALCCFCLYSATPYVVPRPGSFASSPTPRPQALQKKLPECLIIGARKAGTRALLEFLNVHPELTAARGEIHFFDRTFNFRRGLNWYRERMPATPPGVRTMEKSPAYLVTDAVPERVHHMNSSIKLLLIVRHPVTRLLSDYTQTLYKRIARNLSWPPLHELVLDVEGHVDVEYRPVQVSMYSQHISKWLKVFPLSQIHVVDGDALIVNPLPELQLIEQFLGVTPFLKRAHFYLNKSSGFYCLSEVSGSRRCLGASKGRLHPPILPSLRETLNNFFKLSNEQFYNQTGKDFHWE